MTEQKQKLQIPCEVYSRVVGFYRPVDNWNLGKRAEYKNRQNYRLSRLDGDDRETEFIEV